MALDDLVGSNAQNAPMYPHNLGLELSQQPIQPSLGGGILRTIGPEDQLGLGDLLARRGPGLGYIGDGNHNNRPMPLPGLIGGGNFIGIRPPIFGGLQPMPQPAMPDYSSQFEKFGEQLTGFGDQMTGYQDALGSFNEQVGGMGKQFETITNRLDSVDKGLGSLGNQIAGLEQAQSQAQPVMQPQRPTFNPFGFGGLGSLFGRRY
jgi:hypothetical protein